jgi:hypothetical protein
LHQSQDDVDELMSFRISGKKRPRAKHHESALVGPRPPDLSRSSQEYLNSPLYARAQRNGPSEGAARATDSITGNFMALAGLSRAPRKRSYSACAALCFVSCLARPPQLATEINPYSCVNGGR